MVFLMVFQTNPIASAMCLVAALFGLAGVYILLSAPFVGMLQVLVYAGAIMVLFIFVIMLLKLRPEDLEGDRVTGGKFLMTCGAFVFILFLGTHMSLLTAKPFGPVDADFGSPHAVGELLFLKYLVPFEIVSFLILASILGVVLLASRKEQ
jgi:NADH-quinone oxidoreductase subunit J